jgi:tetratricopeptide (TPR) repeat protein
MTLRLKKLGERNLAAAIALAKHYRDLNEPEEAESICRDVLAVAPDSQDAWRTLGLALTDRFPRHWMTLFEEACGAFRNLASEYERVYYEGIAWERYGKAQVLAGQARDAIHAFEQALERFERAETLAAPDDPAPILHYNRCVRALTTDSDLVRASLAPREPEYEFGD